MAFKSIGQRLGFVSIADAERMAENKGMKRGLRKGEEKERANSEKKMNLFAKRLAKKFNVSEEELLALKP